MNGSDFLKKLENLDPNLVAGTAEPPAPKVRRGPDWGAFGAAAACIAAICLPLALMYLVHGVTPTVEPRSSHNSGNASHEASSAAVATVPPDDGSAVKTATEPQISQAGYGGIYSWTQYTLTEEYCDAFPDGLPAEEYFKYNEQGLGEAPEMWLWTSGGLTSDVLQQDEKKKWQDEFTDSLPDKGSAYSDISVSANPEFSDPDSVYPQRLCLQTTRKDAYVWDGNRSNGSLTVNISNRAAIDEETLSRTRAITNETAAIMDKDKIVRALGGLDSDRLLYVHLPSVGLWCYVTGGMDVPPEDVAAVMNWLLSEPEILDAFSHIFTILPTPPSTADSDTALRSYVAPPWDMAQLKEHFPSDIIPYIPYFDNNDYVPPIDYIGGASYGELTSSMPVQKISGIDLYYYRRISVYEDRPLEQFTLELSEEGTNQDSGMGDLYDLTRDMVDSQYNFQKRFMATSRSSDRYKEEQPMQYTFHFTWDDYYVTAAFNESLTADQLWSFFQQLAGREQPKSGETYDFTHDGIVGTKEQPKSGETYDFTYDGIVGTVEWKGYIADSDS